MLVEVAAAGVKPTKNMVYMQTPNRKADFRIVREISNHSQCCNALMFKVGVKKKSHTTLLMSKVGHVIFMARMSLEIRWHRVTIVCATNREKLKAHFCS